MAATGTGTGRTHTVLLAGAPQSSTEFARTSRQLVGALLSTVAGIYLGQRAVEAGIARLEKGGNETPLHTTDDAPGS